MTIQECIDYVDSIEPNAYNNAQKAAWVNEIEGKVYTQLFLVQPYEYKTVTQQLALPAPYDRMYSRYLQAMIHYADGEYNRYQNSYAMFNEVWAEANRWFGGDFDVTDRLRNRSFEVKIQPEPGDQTVFTIPAGCALVAGRIRILSPFVQLYPIYKIHAGDEGYFYFTFHYDNDTDYQFTTTFRSEIGDIVELNPSHTIWVRDGEVIANITPSEGDTGLMLDWTLGNLKASSNFGEYGQISVTEKGALPLPMISADREDLNINITMGPGYWTKEGTVELTGRLLIPDEKWHYDPKYVRRRDARWHG